MRSAVIRSLVITAVLGGGAPAVADEPPALELVLTLDRPAVTAGEKVRLREMINALTDLKFGVVAHDSLLIGKYDEQSGRLTNLDPRLFESRWVEIPKDFPELPMGLSLFHGLEYKVKAPGLKGTEFEFRPRNPGVFLLSARWLVRDQGGEWVTGPPVVLTVRPKPPAN